jgi:hypothetical protein
MVTVGLAEDKKGFAFFAWLFGSQMPAGGLCHGL